MAVDIETQTEVLNALADFWQTSEVLYADTLAEESIAESQRWVGAVRAVAGLIVDGIDVLELNGDL